MKVLNKQLGRMKWLLAVLVAMSCFGAASAMIARESVSPAAHASQKSDGKQKPAGESTELPYVPQQPLDCESFAALVDNALIEWQEMKGTYLIVIARLGEGERGGGLGRTRLGKVESYLNQRYNGKVAYVTAEGNRVKGSGQVELYVGGKLRAAIPIKKNDESVCSGQVNPFF